MSTHSVDVTPSEHVEDPETDVTPSEHVEDPETDLTAGEYVEDPETSCVVPKIKFDFSKLPERPRKVNTEGDMLRAQSLSETQFAGLRCLSPQMSSTTDNSNGLPLLPVNMSDLDTTSSAVGHETSPMMSEAWEALKRAKLHFRGEAVGTVAAMDNSEEKLNYDQVLCASLIICECH